MEKLFFKVYDFTNTYYNASQKLVVRKSNTAFDNCKTVEDVENILKDLQDEKIGYQIGTTGNWYVAGSEDFGFDGFSNIEHSGYKTAQLAISDLVNGQIFAVVVDEAPAKFIVESINSVSSMKEMWNVFKNSISQAEYQKLIAKGLLNTLLIAVIGLFIGVIIGTLIAVVKVTPKYKKVYFTKNIQKQLLTLKIIRFGDSYILKFSNIKKRYFNT